MGTERIETRGADGRQVWVFKTTSKISASTDLSGRTDVHNDLASFTLENGQAVNQTRDGFQVVDTDELLLRV